MSRPSRPARRRIGRVSIYEHHGAWYLYHGDHGRPVRRRVGGGEAQAEVEASLLNARLVGAEAGLVVPGTTGERQQRPAEVESPGPPGVDAAELRRRFLEHHEHVLHSSVATVTRYASATEHLVTFCRKEGPREAAQIDVSAFVQHLRTVEITPNGHANTARRRLRDKGVVYILETCRSMYHFGVRHELLPGGQTNPFTRFGLGRLKVRDAKPVFVFDAQHELAFLRHCDRWSFGIHFVLGKTGMRPGELAHLLIDDLALEQGWLHVGGKSELGWVVKTGRERRVPLLPEVVTLLRQVIGNRTAGPVFLRAKFDPLDPGTLSGDRETLSDIGRERLEHDRAQRGRPLTRKEEGRVLATIWRDTGAVEVDRVRTAFIRIAKAAGIGGATCPKSWRHTFATLMQEANVDPLVRQEVMGHRPAAPEMSALGMTGAYTHTTPAFQRAEIQHALRLRPASLELAERFVTAPSHQGGQI